MRQETRQDDCLITMLAEVRTRRPPVFLADEWAAWVAEVGQIISALLTREQRWAATVLVGDEMAVPGMPLAVAYHVILEAVIRAGGGPHEQQR